MNIADIIDMSAVGMQLSDGEVKEIAARAPLEDLLFAARARRNIAHGQRISFSPKIFVPLTQLCRNVCHYCTFAQPPKTSRAAYLSPDEVLSIVEAGKIAGCREVLFTLGDKPELRYESARSALNRLGYRSTIEYLEAMCNLVVKSTGLLPHTNPGVVSKEEIVALRGASVSQGLMLESLSERLCESGMAHFGSPDKKPSVRMKVIEAAGVVGVPFTTGILIGIGETRDERIDALLALRRIQDQFDHIQEIIVQNFRAKPGTRMANNDEPQLEDHMWTIAIARLIFAPTMNLQAPPNLWSRDYARLIDAGINDWGGISPVTPDYVNPEAPWPHLEQLRRSTESCGHSLVARLPVYPSHLVEGTRWLDVQMLSRALEYADGAGLLRNDDWRAGRTVDPPSGSLTPGGASIPAGSPLAQVLDTAFNGKRLNEVEIATLFDARDDAFHSVCRAANELRAAACGDDVSYVVNRNLNYTNVCAYHCQFCAFSKGATNQDLKGRPYEVDRDEIARRVAEAWERGASEVCMQGGIHPDYTGETYLEILRVAKKAAPDIHVHAFSPLEISQGASTLKISVREFLQQLKRDGLGTLPGTAAEILDDRVRQILCPDKLNTKQWLTVVRTAHEEGLRTTATIMFGHVDSYIEWARHLLRVRDLQSDTGGFTEFVPLPFVSHEAPIYRRGLARPGPTFREALLMHSVARIVLHPLIKNIQVSWTKMGPQGAKRCLMAGANDLGGTLMNESISRAAGSVHGQEFPPQAMEQLIVETGRRPKQRTTLFKDVSHERRDASLRASALCDTTNSPARKYARIGSAKNRKARSQ